MLKVSRRLTFFALTIILSACSSQGAKGESKSNGVCGGSEIRKMFLDQIYQRALPKAREALGDTSAIDDNHGADIATELQALRSKPLMTIESIRGIGPGSCLAEIAFHTGAHVRNPLDGTAPGVRLRGIDDDPPPGLFQGKAAPQQIEFTVLPNPSDGTREVSLVSGWHAAVAAAALLATNRYYDRAMSDLIPAEPPTETSD